MSSTETSSTTELAVCTEDFQKVTQGRENNDRNIIKRIKSTAIDLFTSVLKLDDSSEQHSMASLLQNMKYIKSNISLNINDCYDKPLKAAKLKESIQQALIWILLYYRKLPKNQNSVAYLESMSDLLAMYIDMELRASKRPTEQLSEITTRIICCLYLYLEKSTEHILDTLIKLRNTTSQFHFILDPVMKKILESNGTDNRERPKTETMYVRYLLAFRLWREINKVKAVKKEILKTAVCFLGSPPSHLPEFLTKYIPPNESGLPAMTTNLFMKEKLFDVKASCADFINSCKMNTENLHQQQMIGDNVAAKSSSIIKNNSVKSDKVIDLRPNNSLIKTNSANKCNILDNLSRISITNSTNISSNQSLQMSRPLVRRKVKKSNNIIIIDITDEESTPKVTRKKVQKKFPWLEEIKKHSSPGLNSEKKDGSEISGLKAASPAQNILESLILVTENTDQKKIETELYSSFDSWIGFHNIQPTSDICTFFGDELDARSNSPTIFNSNNTSFTELPLAISSPNTYTSQSVLKIPSNRLNSYDSDNFLEISSDGLSKDITEAESVIQQLSEIAQVPRFHTSKTNCQTEANCMISDSNEHLSEMQETTILEKTSTDHETTVVPSFEQRVEESRDDYSNDIDYTLRNDKTILPPNFKNFESSYERNLYTNQESHFQENIENLSLLASVSQQVASQKGNSPSKTIKIKEYASLRHTSNNETEPKTLYQVPDNLSSDLYNRIVNIYPEDLDKIALQVEVTSTSDGLMENIPQSRETTNAILNGETVVLMQKSPNSNVYVINKATENKNNDDETFEDAEKDDLFQESESLSKGIIIKTELEDKRLRASLEEKKSSSIEVSKSSMDKRKNFNLSSRPNVKQEYSVSSQCACGIAGCSVMHSLSHDLANPQIPLQIPAYSTPSINLPPLYEHFSSNQELCVQYNKHSHTNKNSCGRPHCSTCLTCTYEMVAHCRQCMHPTAEPHSSYIDGNSFFIPQTIAVQELERTKGESMVGNLYENQLLYKIENNLLGNKPLEEIDVKLNQEVKYQVEMNNKLPLKKRLKAYTSMQKPYELPIKMEKSGCYPGTPMMSIANLEVQTNSDVINLPEIGATVELTTAKEDSPIKNRHHSSNLIRRDYRKELEKIRAKKKQRRLADSQLSNVPLYHDSLYQRPIKTSLSRKEIEVASLKRLASVPSLEEQPPKKAKKSSSRQTRSSQRNVPKVNYNYTEVDPEWNPSGDMKRKRKKTSR